MKSSAGVCVAEAVVEAVATLVGGAHQKGRVLRVDGLEEFGVQAGADALGLPGWQDGEFAQAHEASRADVFGDLAEQVGAVPVFGRAGEGVSESDHPPVRVCRDEGEAFVLDVAQDLAAESGGGESVGGCAGVVDEFGVGVGPDVGECIEQGRDFSGFRISRYLLGATDEQAVWDRALDAGAATIATVTK
jgi:hypothetical protein